MPLSPPSRSPDRRAQPETTPCTMSPDDETQSTLADFAEPNRCQAITLAETRCSHRAQFGGFCHKHTDFAEGFSAD